MNYLSVAKTAWDTFTGIVKFREAGEEKQRKKTREDCAQEIKTFADETKRKNLRDRYYLKHLLAKQIIPHDQEIDEVLEYMRKENLASPVGGHPDLWEIAPFADRGKWR